MCLSSLGRSLWPRWQQHLASGISSEPPPPQAPALHGITRTEMHTNEAALRVLLTQGGCTVPVAVCVQHCRVPLQHVCILTDGSRPTSFQPAGRHCGLGKCGQSHAHTQLLLQVPLATETTTVVCISWSLCSHCCVLHSSMAVQPLFIHV